MKEQTFSDNHNHGGRCGLYSHPTVSDFANCLTAELAERGEPLRNNTAVDECYRSVGYDVVRITASALSDWIERRGTAKEFGNIVGRLCLALARADITAGLCPDRTQWKPPMRTMRMLAGFSEKN